MKKILTIIEILRSNKRIIEKLRIIYFNILSNKEKDLHISYSKN